MTNQGDSIQALGEKEWVYRELDRVRQKCFHLRKELQNLHAAFDGSETAALRAEKDGYKAALSNIAYRLEQEGEIDIGTLRSIVYVALDNKNLKPARRRLIERHRRVEGSGGK